MFLHFCNIFFTKLFLTCLTNPSGTATTRGSLPNNDLVQDLNVDSLHKRLANLAPYPNLNRKDCVNRRKIKRH